MGSVLLAAVFIALHFAIAKANPDSKRLYDDLLSNYNRLIRPVGNNSDRLTVKMGLRLSQLIDVVSTFRFQSFIIAALDEPADD
jgi:nicotinic acetylcholine receptor, invertebrate